MSGRGWTRTSNLLFVRQALSTLELLAPEAPGQGLEPQPPRSGRGVLAVRRSRIVEISMSRRALLVPTAMLSKPLAYASALDRGGCRLRNRRRTSFVEAFWSPALHATPELCRQKPLLLRQRQLPLRSGRGPFSLRRGLECLPCLLQLSITFLCWCLHCPQTTRATLSGRPRFELLCRHTTSGSTSERGQGSRRTGGLRTASASTARPSRRAPRSR